MAIALGNEILLAERFELVRNRRVGLITNPSGVNSRLETTADALRRAGVRLEALFGPEHGVKSDRSDGVPVTSSRDGDRGVPVHSLYGEARRPSPEMLRGLDAMLFDIQDVGVRFYTYLTTMVYAMEACAAQGVPFIVLDRPNPIGARMEGPLLEPGLVSFVGAGPIPVRHGMTVGELAHLFQAERKIGGDLTVLPARGWRREMFYDDTDLIWIPPSPNMPTLETAMVYPGMALIEGTELSEGRGTTRPFEQVGGPALNGGRMAARLNDRQVPGAIFRPVTFTPLASKWAGQPCEGVQTHVTDRRIYPSVRAGLEVLTAVRDLFPGALTWRGGREGFPFDRLVGTERVRREIDAGTGAEEITESFEPDLRAFRGRREPYLLYR